MKTLAKSDLEVGGMFRTEKARNFLAKNPTKIGVVLGFHFYEHPTEGDESPLVVVTPDGKVKLSDYWEIPSTKALAAG
jgi:hypothetical protein